MFEDGFAAAFAEENLIAYEHISWTQLARLDLRQETV